ncbi:zinc finger protein 23-like isoform X1 [Hypomesus transpacificus]|uniref:zinc finger protein 23-like isoform X1 n=1 Tax=Hypomesus transpacificus TaxID=137520 RepID=UPI001F07A3D4|nr:zinc finger protein 23-like isoform X1 [Hypomesus transpacificus]XP_046901801.1 zinc finger protein 23-like isoform X1 [Hypomesus transpacificus]
MMVTRGTVTGLVSIMEVLANAAVADICQLVDDGYAVLRLEISRAQRENLALKSKLRLMEVRSRDRFARRSPLPHLAVSCARKAHVAVKHSINAKKNAAGSRLIGDQGTHLSTVCAQPEDPLEYPELVLIKEERQEEELKDCNSHLAQENAGVSHSLPANNNHTRKVETLLDQHRSPGSTLPGLQRPGSPPEHPAQGSQEQAGDSDVLKTPLPGGHHSTTSQQLQPHHMYAGGCETAGSSSQMASLGDAVEPSCSFSLEAMRSFGAEVPLLLGDGESLHGFVNSLGLGRVDSLKMERGAESSWADGKVFGSGLSLDPIPGRDREDGESASNLSSQTHESKSSELEATGFDSSFDELFSSPDANVVQVLHRNGGGGTEGQSSYQFLASGGGFGGLTEASPRIRLDPERVLHCEQCGRLFHNARDLVVHQRSHAGERLFHCPQCKKPFLHLHQLKTHQRVHTGEKPFSCAQCGRHFSQSSHIKRHMSVHTGEKRYSCSLCGKRFSQACSLKVHQSVHTGERPYSCTQCGKSFSVLGNLVRHQSVHIRK